MEYNEEYNENMREKEMERILKALANKRRLAIVKYLRKSGKATVSDISDYLSLSFKATSKHLCILASVDIIEKDQKGLQMWYHLLPSIPPLVKQISNSLE